MNNWEALSDDSKVWMYGANRALTASEVTAIDQMLSDFCDAWSAHGTKLDCGYEIIHNQLIILGVDEKSAAASGCSIDTSVQIFRDINSKYDLDLFNRLRSYHVDSDTIDSLTSKEVQTKVAVSELDSSSTFIDMLLSTKGALNSELIKPMAQTWLSKYIPV
ncbi:MAG: hypothetical protein ACI8SE_000242 [Bacteroidia bacterium]|jgi:hypothetical protein